ncbi:M48 family metalloprotease [Luteolibacter sp. GHJ8]|uniref:M48 family metalloprotease n=1 Tax=Luteolibacter rhizosphaerae TaxID=2989719 RepID=A0ABT3FYZ2_9BACT|nr:M48 family metalloprotease [Luteolibacter rhizosphaerae]MCW1912802.1 M48 family metalloprotease [Luteolibacter rhizosphaerae]
MSRTLSPLPQHQALVDWIRSKEPEVWAWQSDAERLTQDAEEVRLSLLRDSYRMDAEGHPELFAEIRAAQEALGLSEIQVHAYQAQGRTDPNAAICYLPGEAHLIFTGPILTLLSGMELRAVIGHELAHYLLWQMGDGAYYLADRILHQSAAHAQAEPSHIQSARLWSLATELFADRGSYQATGCLETAVASLVKTSTGLAHVSGKSYLSQAAEIFSKSKPKTEQLTHPETFMRARALQLWVEEGADLDAAVALMLEEGEGLDELDLTQQVRLTALTRRFLEQHLRPAWFRSDAVLAHARLFFPDFKPAEVADEALLTELLDLSKARREYLCQVMLDFCAVDPDLDELPVAAGIEQSRAMESLGHFEKLATKELKVKAKDLKRLKEQSATLLAQAATNPTP